VNGIVGFVSAYSSYPPSSCRKCERTDANWIVSALGCAHCFDPFATASRLKVLTRLAETADDLVAGRRSIDALEKAVEEWRSFRGT
jgi:hypothetical protein